MPNGDIVNFPDDMPKEQIRDMIASKFPDVVPQLALQAQPQQQEPQGFIGGIGQSIQRRAADAGRIQQSRRSGDINRLEEAYQLAGKAGAGLVGDVSGQFIKEGVELASGLDKLTGGYIGSGLSGVAGAIGSLPSMGGGTIGQAIPQEFGRVADQYGEFAQQNPRLATNLEAGANLLALSPALKYGEDVFSAAGKIKKSLSKSDIAKMSSNDIRKQASKLYDVADQKGGALKSDFVDQYVETISKIRPQTDIGKALRGNDKAAYVVEKLDEFKSQPITLRGLKEVDEILGELAYDTVDIKGAMSAEGKKLIDMQMALRDMVDKADTDMFIGGRDGFEAVKDARKFWSASLRLQDVERIIQKADGAAQPSTVVKNGFRRLRDSKSMRYFTPEEQFAIKKAAKTGSVESFLKLGASGLVPIISGTAGAAATGGVGALAAIPAYALQQAAKKGAEALQLGKANRVQDAIKSSVFTQQPRQALLPALNDFSQSMARTTNLSGAVAAGQDYTNERLSDRVRRAFIGE